MFQVKQCKMFHVKQCKMFHVKQCKMFHVKQYKMFHVKQCTKGSSLEGRGRGFGISGLRQQLYKQLP